MLVVVEGLDGAGKSTQVRRLRAFYEAHGYEVEFLHFPRYDAPVYGELIASFLRGGFGAVDKVHPKLVALLYAEDRHKAAPKIKAALSEGKLVLLDRYVYSNVAYQCAKLSGYEARENLREWILNTEFGAFDLPRPDLNIFLDVPLSFVEQKLGANRKGGDRSYLAGGQDIHESDLDLQRNVRKAYLRQCELDPHFIRVDCSAPDGSMLDADSVSGKLLEVAQIVL